MRIRHRRFPLLITLSTLLFVSVSAAGPDSGNDIQPRKTLVRSEPPVSTVQAPNPRRAAPGEIGTKDAPVDGLDGKPHAGPFVDTSRDAELLEKERARLRASYNKFKPEDGVMNDMNRPSPKKGTTGTEGGVTEKDRDRKAHELVTGEKKLNRPDPPKAAPPIPPSTSDSAKKASSQEEKMKAEAEKFRVAHGVEKPTELPAPPFDGGSAFDPNTDGVGKPTWSGSNDGLELQEEEGIHDFVRWDSLVGSFTSIAATEIGDKTFIVAALMAMRHPRLQVFSAAASALFVMTILSGLTGHAVGAIISKKWAAVVAALLFLGFGAKSLKEGLDMSPDQGVGEEMREVQAELDEKEIEMARGFNGRRRSSSISPYALEAGRGKSRSRSQLASARRSQSLSPERSPSPHRGRLSASVSGIKNLLSLLLSPAWVETFSMTFIGELGDRSQIATVAMAAGQEYYWIMVGATAGHLMCTAFAVLGGSVMAGKVSMRKVTLGGGAIFIGFGLFTLVEALQYF